MAKKNWDWFANFFISLKQKLIDNAKSEFRSQNNPNIYNARYQFVDGEYKLSPIQFVKFVFVLFWCVIWNFAEDQTLYFRSDDEFLLIFLRPCKFYPESAFALMKRIAEFREKNTSILQNISVESDKKFLLETTVVNVLRNRDQKKRRILVVNAGKLWDPSKLNADHLFRLFYLIHLAAVLEPETQVNFVLQYELIRSKKMKIMNWVVNFCCANSVC